MAFREVTMLEVKEILRLWLLGVPKKQIAAQLGFDVPPSLSRALGKLVGAKVEFDLAVSNPKT